MRPPVGSFDIWDWADYNDRRYPVRSNKPDNDDRCNQGEYNSNTMLPKITQRIDRAPMS